MDQNYFENVGLINKIEMVLVDSIRKRVSIRIRISIRVGVTIRVRVRVRITVRVQAGITRMIF